MWMTRILAVAAYGLITYLMAVPLTKHVSMDLSLTNWSSLWTYFYWLFSPVLFSFVIGFIFNAFLLVVWVLLFIIDKIEMR